MLKKKSGKKARNQAKQNKFEAKLFIFIQILYVYFFEYLEDANNDKENENDDQEDEKDDQENDNDD